ncbi:hypothetical protein [Polynucleobacter sp. UB-Piko-W3]|uniref:hypothetical protein n=1 Tax=Polynucleobacter sp. UB-Piko-W3 TaxID=1819735 RepID=UPI001C0CA686|nr:hypothetical protein [Polynucleobacter sp. UB-Piko-W3]MBU3553966.1 hypothetical protein [Polynucleobacter sp. UB-Piko-W3]
MNNRFLIDYDNPDAGIGHSMGIMNRAIKIAARNNLQFAYSEKQLQKSHKQSFRWNLKQSLRKLRGRRANETHNIGDDLNRMLDPKRILTSREDLEQKIKKGEVKVIELPEFEIHIPTNDQVDDEIYKAVDAFIQQHPGPNIAFKISNNRFGDYEYGPSRDWFIKAYTQAREHLPIPLMFDPKKINIAVHIRRGDLLPGRQFSDLSSRMLPDAWYLEILNTILNHSPRSVAIHIYSEGKDGQYRSETGAPFSWKERFQNTGYEVHEHIDSDFMGTFHHLLHADVLIGSKSGMSHLAGMLGDQVKLMPQMWHSYRGANKLLELPSSIGDIDQQTIASHIKLNLR